MKQQEMVIIVGAGPAGIATSACLNQLSIPNLLLEREACFASLWKEKTYDRLHLHLPKQFCELPHMSFPNGSATYISRKEFIQYLDDYVSRFEVNPIYNRSVDSACFDGVDGKWCVKAKNVVSGEFEEYVGKFLVVASGETSDAYVPEVDGLDSFKGDVLHSTAYSSGGIYRGKNVLVVGCGNSGMEISLDLANFGAKTFIVMRNPAHILKRELVYMGLVLLKYLPVHIVDGMLVLASKLVYGNISKYGIQRPKEGPFLSKVKYGKYPVIDVGTVDKIKSGDIQVVPSIRSIKGEHVEFVNGVLQNFDTIIFATGFKRSINKWLKDDGDLLDQDGIPKSDFPNHWKGQNGLYCVGLSRRGLYGIAMDAEKVAADIKAIVSE